MKRIFLLSLLTVTTLGLAAFAEELPVKPRQATRTVRNNSVNTPLASSSVAQDDSLDQSTQSEPSVCAYFLAGDGSDEPSGFDSELF